MNNEQNTNKAKIAELVIRIQNGDKEAFNELYLETQKYIRYSAFQCCQNKENAEDIVQETYITIFKKIDSLKDPSSAYAWISQIVRTKSIDYFRKNSKIEFVSEDGEYLSDDILENDKIEMPEDIMENKETQKLIHDIINKLPEIQKMIVLDYYYNELKVNEIADLYNMPSGTVKTYLSKSRKFIKSEVEDLNKKHGIKLYSVSALPVLYIIFRNSIIDTYAKERIPEEIMKSVISNNNIGKIKGNKTIKGAKNATITILGKKISKKVVISAICGVVLIASIGTISTNKTKDNGNYEHSDKKEIEYIKDNKNSSTKKNTSSSVKIEREPVNYDKDKEEIRELYQKAYEYATNEDEESLLTLFDEESAEYLRENETFARNAKGISGIEVKDITITEYVAEVKDGKRGLKAFVMVRIMGDGYSHNLIKYSDQENWTFNIDDDDKKDIEDYYNVYIKGQDMIERDYTIFEYLRRTH